MTFEEMLDQAIAMLQRRGRVTYRTLKRQFQLDDDVLEDLKEELIYGQRLAVDEDGRVLVWTGGASAPPGADAVPPPRRPHAACPARRLPPHQLHRTRPMPNAASSPCCFVTWWTRRVLASQLDPEELREVVRAYQETCAKVIARFEGHIAQYLGDGLLVYFGYPLAHEDDAQRAVRAGLGMVEAVGQLNTRLAQERGVQPGRAPGDPYRAGGSGGGGRRHPAGTVGARRDAQPRRPPARDRGAQYAGDQCRHLAAARRLLCLPVVRHPAPERPRPAPGGLSGAV